MGNINWCRVIGGGLLAGLVINIVEFVVNGKLLAEDWATAMKALGKTGAIGAGEIAMFNLWGFAMGLVVVWLYAAIRPRFGPGPKTACTAALAAWIMGYVMANVPPAVMGMFPYRLMIIGILVGLVEVAAGALLGAWIYKEETTAA